jgi:hypothetical protein
LSLLAGCFANRRVASIKETFSECKSKFSIRRTTALSTCPQGEATAFRGDPDAALRELPEPVLIDEWQMVPGVLGAVRRAVDSDSSPNRFLLTGSVRATLANEGRDKPGSKAMRRTSSPGVPVARSPIQ